MAWKDWSPDLPVIVLGVKDGEVAEGPGGIQRFANFDEARKVFPDLDPARNSERFTWAMRDVQDGKVVARFETWKANDFYTR